MPTHASGSRLSPLRLQGGLPYFAPTGARCLVVLHPLVALRSNEWSLKNKKTKRGGSAGFGMESRGVEGMSYSSANCLGISVAKGGLRMNSAQLVSRSLLDPAEMNFWKML